MRILFWTAALSAQAVSAFPWVVDQPGVDSSPLRHARRAPNAKRQGSCPFNANHPGAAPYNPQYPYTGAKNGLPGTGIGGIKVPADGDTAHAFEAPGPGDIRGPCPGLNTAANHHFLSHDGITTFNELVDAQQNLYNVGYDLAVTLATLGVALDGDVVTGKLSLGCDATSRTSATGSLLGNELGLNGHNVSLNIPRMPFLDLWLETETWSGKPPTHRHALTLRTLICRRMGRRLLNRSKEIRRRHFAHPQRLLPRQRGRLHLQRHPLRLHAVYVPRQLQPRQPSPLPLSALPTILS